MVELMVGMMGILKSGAAYVPLGPTFPGRTTVDDYRGNKGESSATQRHFDSRLATSMINTIYLDADEKSFNKSRRQNPLNPAKSENLVHVMFTPGSTGKPKGVAIEHRQLLIYVNAILDRLSISTPSRFAVEPVLQRI